MPTVPPKLRPGDHLRVIAPSSALASIEPVHRELIDARFAELGLSCSLGARTGECGPLGSAPIASRVYDLHEAFRDPGVAGIITVIGGYDSNQLLPYLDWDLIRANPKVFCGFSDISALQNAMLARAGLVTYSGPHWSGFGMRDRFGRTLRGFRDAVFGTEPYELDASDFWTDDAWFLDQDDRDVRPNEGWWILQPGTASGRIVGGNLVTVTTLLGSSFLPALAGAVLLIEDDFESHPQTFDRQLTALLQQPGADRIAGVAIGRFQHRSNMTRDLLGHIVATKRELTGRPVIANVDFGHTNPILTFPIGGIIEMNAGPGARLRITEH